MQHLLLVPRCEYQANGHQCFGWSNQIQRLHIGRHTLSVCHGQQSRSAPEPAGERQPPAVGHPNTAWHQAFHHRELTGWPLRVRWLSRQGAQSGVPRLCQAIPILCQGTYVKRFLIGVCIELVSLCLNSPSIIMALLITTMRIPHPWWTPIMMTWTRAIRSRMK